MYINVGAGLWYIPTVEYYTGAKKIRGPELHMSMWIKLKILMWSKNSALQLAESLKCTKILYGAQGLHIN